MHRILLHRFLARHGDHLLKTVVRWFKYKGRMELFKLDIGSLSNTQDQNYNNCTVTSAQCYWLYENFKQWSMNSMVDLVFGGKGRKRKPSSTPEWKTKGTHHMFHSFRNRWLRVETHPQRLVGHCNPLKRDICILHSVKKFILILILPADTVVTPSYPLYQKGVCVCVRLSQSFTL